DNVSMNDIAGALEMNKATLYLYFKNKDSLYFAVLVRGLCLMRDAFAEAVKGKRTGLDRLLATCEAFFKYCREHPEYYRELCHARTRSFCMGEVDCAAEQMALADEVVGGICGHIRQGIEDGTVRKGIDPRETAVFVMTACEKMVRPGVDMEWVLSRQNISREQYIGHSMGLLLFAISESKAKRKAGKC
ncbi:MAG TPA: TetR/AcrR family transcriptional regulator, partial [Methanocella sp.]|nr:TetR/AcrR family transcriptional regulator [Methanocella sp.]